MSAHAPHTPPHTIPGTPWAPPGPGTPARIPARVVSPGPLSHVRWQSIPSCLHSSAVKTATSGLGPARTPRVWERACWRGAQGHTWGHPPLCACAPSESICTRMSVCAGVPGSVDMHERRKLTGPRGSPDPWAGASHEDPCLCEGHAPRAGLSLGPSTRPRKKLGKRGQGGRKRREPTCLAELSVSPVFPSLTLRRTNVGSEAWRGPATCPRLHSLSVVEPASISMPA